MNDPGELDLEVYRGDDYVHTLFFRDMEDPPAPHNLSELTFKAQIRATPEQSPIALAVFTIDDSLSDEGLVVISLTPGQTRIQPGYWDLQVTDGSNTQTWLAGKVIMKGDVTQEVGT